ncbi:MAG: sugar phosphate nucleotidyltransferase [Firmicutes bacterium]|nr:sugar phosphate nucleotidyltransferase [Bacillota bacterium]
MKAVIMAGGQGTRLRPLSCDVPKPMVPIMNRPMLEHIILLLRQHGITEIAVTLCHLPEVIQDYFGDGGRWGVNLRYYLEETPLGTAGSVHNADDFLDETFLVISGDALTDFDLTRAVQYHRERRALATLLLTRVESPLEYGVVMTEADGRIRQFYEKPGWSEVFSDTVNTGIYVLDPEIFNFFRKGQPFDFSKDLFPIFLREKETLFGYVADGYWSDIGNLEQYRQSHYDVLSGQVNIGLPGRKLGEKIWVGQGTEVSPGAQLYGPLVIGDHCRIEAGAILHPYTVVGNHSTIKSGATLKRTILWNNVLVEPQVELRGAVVAGHACLRPRSAVFEGAIVGRDCYIGAGAVVKPQVKIWPNKVVEPGATVTTSLVWGNRLPKAIFGQLGVGGTTNVEITPEFAAKLGAAFGSTIAPGSAVVVGSDVQRPSRMIKRALAAGLLSAGVDVYDLGTVTTPVIRHGITSLGVKGGVQVRVTSPETGRMLLEFLDEKGLPLARSRQRSLENTFFREDFDRAESQVIGEMTFVPRVVAAYLAGLLERFDVQAIRKAQCKVVASYDAGNLSFLLPAFLDALGCRAIPVTAAIPSGQGMFDPAPDRLPGGGDSGNSFTSLTEVIARVAGAIKAEAADLGLVVDGNGEKLLLITSRGQPVNEAALTTLISSLLLEKSEERSVVVPVTAPQAVEKLAERLNGRVIRAKADPRSVMERALPFFHPAFDALFSLGKVLEAMAAGHVSLDELVAALPSINMNREDVTCPWQAKGRVMRSLLEESQEGRVELLDGVKIFHDEGWALVLPDAEEPVFHLYCEARTQEAADSLIADYVRKISEMQKMGGFNILQ